MLPSTLVSFLVGLTVSSAFTSRTTVTRILPLQANLNVEQSPLMEETSASRRSFISSLIASGAIGIASSSALADEEGEESFAAIAARASKLSGDLSEKIPLAKAKSDDTRTAYDFELPVQGNPVLFKDLVMQEVTDNGVSKVKAIVVTNMKEDDPISRKDIPEFISLAAKYAKLLLLFFLACSHYCFLIPCSFCLPLTGTVVRVNLSSLCRLRIKATTSLIHPL